MKFAVEVLDGGNVVGTILVNAEDEMADSLALAAVAFSGITMRVGDREVTQHEIEEWWA